MWGACGSGVFEKEYQRTSHREWAAGTRIVCVWIAMTSKVLKLSLLVAVAVVAVGECHQGGQSS